MPVFYGNFFYSVTEMLVISRYLPLKFSLDTYL